MKLRSLKDVAKFIYSENRLQEYKLSIADSKILNLIIQNKIQYGIIGYKNNKFYVLSFKDIDTLNSYFKLNPESIEFIGTKIDDKNNIYIHINKKIVQHKMKKEDITNKILQFINLPSSNYYNKTNFSLNSIINSYS